MGASAPLRRFVGPIVCFIGSSAQHRLRSDQSFSDHFWIARISRISKHYATYLLLMSLFTSASASKAFLRASRFRRAPDDSGVVPCCSRAGSRYRAECACLVENGNPQRGTL